jgi:hypothetical protein
MVCMVEARNSPSSSWAFRARFRSGAFGWKGSWLAIERIAEALTEIRAVARHDPAAAAEGAVLLLEKLSPALSNVDSSSGALGNATHAAVQELAVLIGAALVGTPVRKKWLNRLFEAIQSDDPTYIESLGDHWGMLCATEDLASEWADHLLPTLRDALSSRTRGAYAYFPGTTLCYSALFKARRHAELLNVLAMDSHPIFPYAIWGARVLAHQGNVEEAIAYLKDRSGKSTSEHAIARFAEDLLLKADRRSEAFDRYALLANQGNSNLSTFRALAKKYPELEPAKLLDHLVESTPTEPGKWFSTAKTLKMFDRARQLAWMSPCDPRTLVRAARDHRVAHPEFAMQCALAALHWMSMGHGYELTSTDVVEAHQLATEIGGSSPQTEQVSIPIEQILDPARPMASWMRRALGLLPTPDRRSA